jgi:DsbC/DsbD-like thiol-disulfide interchange protein
MMVAVAFRLIFLAGIVVPGLALAARSDWVPADQSQLRLLLTTDETGQISGGIEITLDPTWYTYWRNPGEAGVPPVFDFSASENVAGVEMMYPAPMRYDDGASVSLIYRDEVVFPFTVTPLKAGESVTLRLKAQFGVCSTVCIPTSASSEVTLPPNAAADPLSDARLAEAANLIPKPAEPGRFAIDRINADGDKLAIEVLSPDSTYSDLFSEAPAGWYIGQPTFVERVDGRSRYRLSLAGKPDGADVRGQTFRFVAVAGGEAIEESVLIR